MTERLVYGCHKCLAIFRPDFLYVDENWESEDDILRCPKCGDYALELGYAPWITQRKEGQWFLCDETNVMGPYPSEEDAEKDLWSWFGGAPNAKRSEEGLEPEGPEGASLEGAGEGDA